ncbi:hypothetical protein AB7M35_002047 [Amorphus suaedae]
MIRPIIVLAGMAAGLSPVFATCPSPLVVVQPGEAPTYQVPESEVRDDMEALFGAAPDPRSVLVVAPADRKGYWIARDSLQEAAVALGADRTAFVYSGPDTCVPRDVPMDLDRLPNKEVQPLPDGTRKPIELFPDGTAGGPQPRSGLWQARLGETQMRGCPAMMQKAFPVSPGKLPAEMMAPRRLDVQRPFHPDQLPMTQQMKVRWKPAGPNRWTTSVMPGSFAKIPGGGSSLIWSLRVVDAGTIEHITTVRVSLPPEAAAVMGTGTDCRVESVNHWVRVGE